MTEASAPYGSGPRAADGHPSSGCASTTCGR